MNAGLVPCERDGCGHRRGLHKAGGACAAPGCPCGSFVGELPDPRSVPDADETIAAAIREVSARRVCVDVPPGYAVSIELVPIVSQEEVPT